MKKFTTCILSLAVVFLCLFGALSEANEAEASLPVEAGLGEIEIELGEDEISQVIENEAPSIETVEKAAAPDAEIISISKKATVTVYLGTSYQVDVVNKAIASCKSSKTKVAAVTDDGCITLIKAGTAKITVRTTDKKSIALTLKVIDPTVATKITLTNGKKATIYVGDTLQLGYVLTPDTATSTVTWSSGSKKVAAVERETGLVTALKSGKASITAKTSSGKKAKITVTVRKASERPADAPTDGQQPPEMPGSTTEPGTGTESTGAVTLTEDSTGASYSSSTGGENAVLVSGSAVRMTNAFVTKTGSSNGEDADFYGTNAAILAKNSASLTITGSEITTEGSHANAVFSYGSGTTVDISDSIITTTGNNSGGIMTTGGAAMKAANLTVSTSGNSSAAIRSDRGGGTVRVTGGNYSSGGVGSPAIYSTADIKVSNATLSAGKSEAVVIEGGNSVTLENVSITGNNSTLNGQSTVKTNVLIYQSMSGDAKNGNSTFTMTGGTMTAKTGVMFHVTNVTTTINLNGVKFVNAGDTFLSASADSWGTSGKNGGHVTLNLINQEITGAITMDSTSSVAVNLDSNSTWTLTGDSYVSAFNGDLSHVVTNGHTLYVNGVATA